jgi:hypothetical protein
VHLGRNHLLFQKPNGAPLWTDLNLTAACISLLRLAGTFVVAFRKTRWCLFRFQNNH